MITGKIRTCKKAIENAFMIEKSDLGKLKDREVST